MTRAAVTGLGSAMIVATTIVAPVSGFKPQLTPPPTVVGQPQRDAPPTPTTRRVPVGSSVISGTVTAADTGRPLRGVRVTVNGNTGPVTSLLSASQPTRSGGAPSGAPAGRGGGPVGSLTASRTALTDAQGNFVIDHLPAGQYSVSASRNTYLTANYGQKKPAGPGKTLALAEGQKVNLDLQLVRGGVISGTVFGEDGEPLAQTQVQLWRFTTLNGTKRLQRNNGTSTDDRGTYRMPALQPGDYLVSATVNNSDAMMADRMLADTTAIAEAIRSGAIQPPSTAGQPATVTIPMPQPPQNRPMEMPPGYVPVFHPNTIEARNATMVRVAGGDEHRFIDIQVRLMPATNIVGSVTNPPGDQLGVQLALINEDSFMDSPNMTRADSSGQFIFRNVAPGRYIIAADVVSSPQPTVVNGVTTQRVGPLPALDDSQKWWGRGAVTVDGQGTAPASITLRPGKSISGMVIFDMAQPPDLTRARLTVSLQNAPDSPQIRYSQLPQAPIGPDGRFTLNGVTPGRYQIRASGFMKSAIIEGKDTLDFPLDFTAESDLSNAVLTVTDQLSEIGGTLTNAAGTPGADETVIIASTDDRYWTPGSRRIAFTRTRADGQYVFRNLPPGTYMIAVVTDLEFGMQYDVELLRSIASTGSTRVTLAEGEKVLRDLRVSR